MEFYRVVLASICNDSTFMPVGLNPEEFGSNSTLKEITFANNDIEFRDKTGIDHSKFGFGLKITIQLYARNLF